MADLVKLNVKLATGVDLGAVARRLTHLPGVVRATQVFPDEQDEELRRLYLIETSSKDADELIATIRSSAGVDYVEGAPRRKLIRPRSAAR